MAFKDKVYKCIVELGEESTLAQISEALSTRAFFSLKDKFQKLENEIIKKHNEEFYKKLDTFDDDLRKTIREIIKEEIKNGC